MYDITYIKNKRRKKDNQRKKQSEVFKLFKNNNFFFWVFKKVEEVQSRLSAVKFACVILKSIILKWPTQK